MCALKNKFNILRFSVGVECQKKEYHNKKQIRIVHSGIFLLCIHYLWHFNKCFYRMLILLIFVRLTIYMMLWKIIIIIITFLSTTTSEQFRFKSKQRVNEQKRKQLKRRMAKFLDQVKHNQKSINYLQINWLNFE